jgi:hypothetical protein
MTTDERIAICRRKLQQLLEQTRIGFEDAAVADGIDRADVQAYLDRCRADDEAWLEQYLVEIRDWFERDGQALH